MAFKISKLTRLCLGYVGENESRIIDIDVTDWLDQWPDAIIAMTVQRPQEKNTYIPVTEVKGSVLSWTVRREDVAIAGNGMAQIRALQAHTGRVYMSRVVPTVIAASMTGEVDDGAPPPETGWVNTVLLAAADAQQSEDDAKGHADRAEAAVVDLEQTAAAETQKAVAAIQAKGVETLATIPEEYTDLINDVGQLSGRLNSNIEPFFMIEDEMTETNKMYTDDGERTLRNCSAVKKCPRYIGWNIPDDTSRLCLYIGDMVDGEFVLDENYVFNTTSSGVKNYLGAPQCSFIEVEEGKYYYYSKIDDTGIEIIGLDKEFPESDINIKSFTPYFSTTTGEFRRDNRYNSIVIPAGCFYVINCGIMDSVIVTIPAKSEDYAFEPFGKRRFGYIAADAGCGVIRFPNEVDLTKVQIYVNAKKSTHKPMGRNRKIIGKARQLVEAFTFESKKAIPWSDSNNTLAVGKRFYGVPYSTGWKTVHYVGLEVTPETAANAANDEHSIFYDQTEDRTEIDLERGGPGYGLVCSSGMCFCADLPYSQTIRGMSYDSNFEFVPTKNPKSGDMYTSSDHIVYIAEVFDNGYVLYGVLQPCISATNHTGTGGYKALASRTMISYLDDYDYVVNVVGGYDESKQYTTFEGLEIPNGDVRPWRGHKSACSDESAFIGVTVHGDATKIYIVAPDGTATEIPVTGTVMDIRQYCTESGVYELYSDTSAVREKFKYFKTEPVTLAIDDDGTITFSDDRIECARIGAAGYGPNAPRWSGGEGMMTVHKNAKYPGLKGNILEAHTAMAYDEWGMYPVACSLAKDGPNDAATLSVDGEGNATLLGANFSVDAEGNAWIGSANIDDDGAGSVAGE